MTLLFRIHLFQIIPRNEDVHELTHVIENRFGKRLDKNIAMGAEQWVDVYRYKNVADCISKLREDGYQIIATTPHNDSTLLPDFSPLEKSAIFFGTAGRWPPRPTR